MVRLSSVAFLGVLVCGTSAVAHPGPRIWVSIDSGKVTTYAGPYPPGDPANYHVAFVFTQPLADEGDDVWVTDFPGFQRVPGGAIPNGATFNYNITGPLLWYNPGNDALCPFFQPVQEYFAGSPVPQVAVTNENFQTRYTSSGFVAGDPAFAYNGSAGDHNHLAYTLLGDGVTPGGGLDGIYAIPLQLTRSGSASSDTFFLLLGRRVTTDDLLFSADVMEFPRIPADLDCDGDVDLDDHQRFVPCIDPGDPRPVAPTFGVCPRADFDLDFDVDLLDFAEYQRCFTGAGVRSDPDCDE
jgi:hypothetical protein